MAIESINPANGTLLRSFEPLSSDVIRQKLNLAEEASLSYPAVPLSHRTLWMRKLASLLEVEVEDLAKLITIEMGKPIASARQEVLKCALGCRYYADNGARILAPEAVA